ncbi:2-hydroxy-3-oxopropionate reductase [Agrobacterium salinitolerans]|uniref:NAD(P)-dependent oxidoreductase n=1 Tax=Agrobacterium salinitolerans TaxID=1183413 RepID=UPI00098FCB36|nr:NAD(P)-dependent oxidoreductase [Agrobacterium salinitolerans]OOO27865.1 2-hydroxy-3-oxopropionate reductase [Agrobacterium salinitolerans]PNQ25764.1 NAD(P)-dependent oxidoreductase [Rhizobium sp. YIC5082]
MTDNFTIGFVGLGVMGGAMCRNVALKHPGRVIAFDMNDEAFSILDGTNAERAASIAAVSAHSDFILLSLPGGPQVKAVADEVGRHGRFGATIVDLSTTPVALARQIADELSQLGLNFVDAPVARTREAAQRGELSIMVGATKDVFGKVKPILEYMATDITHGGEVGAGQVLKLVNNMLVFEHVVTLAEMIVLGERAGVNAETLLDAVSKGSGDSFVLRNHGRKAMLPRQFPERSFPPEYVLKDIDYVFQLAAETGVPLKAAETVRRYYEMAIEKGLGGQYFPGVIRLVEDGSMSEVPA